MNLRNKYGEKNKHGFYIDDCVKWQHYAQRPEIYNKNILTAFLLLLIPIVGMIFFYCIIDKMGLSAF